MAKITFDSLGRSSKYILLNGISNNVLNYKVIRGFAPITTLGEISNADKYQRDIDSTHAEEIKQYLEKGKGRFFPEIILGINLNSLPEAYKEMIKIEDKWQLSGSSSHFDAQTKGSQIRVYFDKNGKIPKEVKDAITRIDGNHRLYHAIDFENKGVPSEYMVSFCLILFTGESPKGNEELIFHIINHKAKSLIDEENFKVIVDNPDTFSNSDLRKGDPELLLTRLIGREEIPTIKPLYKNFGTKRLTRIYQISEILIKLKYLDIDQTESRLKEDILDLLGKINVFYDSLEPKEKIAKLEYIIPLIAHVFISVAKKDDIETKLWLNRFVDWLQLNNLFDLTNVCYDEIWDIFHEIYLSKSNKVFISMEYNTSTPDVFDAIAQVIQEINSELGLALEPIRIDEYRKGVTYFIPEEILKQIREGGLLIGDLTNRNANVYHEIGYMTGLCHGKGIEEQVILILKANPEEEEEQVEFNLAGKRQIRFTNCVDLKNKLKEELKAYCIKYKPAKYPAE